MDIIKLLNEYSKVGLQNYFSDLDYELVKKVEQFKERTKEKITLTIIYDNEADEACKSYIRNKTKIASAIGINTSVVDVSDMNPDTVWSTHIRPYIRGDLFGGVVIQLPAEKHNKDIADMLPQDIDADCLGKEAYSAFMLGDYNIMPCTAGGIIRHMKHLQNKGFINWFGKTAWIQGRSHLVGDPIALSLRDKFGMGIIQTHSNALDLNMIESALASLADVVILTAPKHSYYDTVNKIGKCTPTYDVPIFREEGTIRGAIMESAKHKSCITPVPGGVGPMTVRELMFNTIALAEEQIPF